MKTKYRLSFENTYIGPVENNTNYDYFFDDKTDKSTQTDSVGNGDGGGDTNNNKLMFSNLNYECWMKSSTMGEIRFYAGHHKHVFATCDRPILCEVVKGQIKVKCETRKWTVTEHNKFIKLNPNSKYFVKNNSLRNECVVVFKLEQN